MKKKYYILIIIVALLLCVFFVIMTFQEDKKENTSSPGDITIIEGANQMTEEERIELEQNMAGDEAVMTEDTPVLMCYITDENNTIIGSNYLPLIAMASYHDTVTKYLEEKGHKGILNLSVIDGSAYKVDNYYYFSFFIKETQETLFCAFNELTLAFSISCS